MPPFREAFKHNNQSFLELAHAALAKYQIEARGELDQRKQAVEILVEPIRQSLER